MISRALRHLRQRRRKPIPKAKGISQSYVTIRPNAERFADAHAGATNAFRRFAEIGRSLAPPEHAPGDRAYTLPSVVLRQDRADFRQAPIDRQCRWSLTVADPAHAGVTVSYGCEKWDGHAGEHRSSFVAPEMPAQFDLAWTEPA